MREMNSWIEIDKAEAGRMIKAIDGKKHNNRIIRMNEADGGFKRPSDEGRRSSGGDEGGRKRTYGPPRERRY